MPTEWFPHAMHTNFIWPVRALLFYTIGGQYQRILNSWLNTLPFMAVGFIVWVTASYYYGHIGINGVYGLSAVILMCLIGFTVPALYEFASWIKQYKGVCSLLVGGANFVFTSTSGTMCYSSFCRQSMSGCSFRDKMNVLRS